MFHKGRGALNEYFLFSGVIYLFSEYKKMKIVIFIFIALVETKIGI